VTGKCPGSPLHVISAPNERKPTIWSANGLTSSGAPPVRVKVPWPAARNGSRKRDVVPEMVAVRSADPVGAPLSPHTVTRYASRSISRPTPRSARAPSMASVSSANSTPSSTLVSAAAAAHKRARLVWLFDPGTHAVSSGGEVSGISVRPFMPAFESLDGSRQRQAPSPVGRSQRSGRASPECPARPQVSEQPQCL
jgi:hypothetical protein